MPKPRRKIAAVFKDFQSELDRLERFDAENQARFSASTGAAQHNNLSRNQLHFLTEAIFLRAFRACESFVRDIFLLYCLEKRPRSGAGVTSYLRPKSFTHAEELIQSSMRFLDWMDPDHMIARAELYLRDGFPIKIPYTTYREALRDLKYIRNHIAHDSKESLTQYAKVLRKHYGTTPLTIPTPGEFLLVTVKTNPQQYKLLFFLDLLRSLSVDLT